MLIGRERSRDRSAAASHTDNGRDGAVLSPLLMVMDEVECPLLSRSFGAMSRWSAAAVADLLFRCGL